MAAVTHKERERNAFNMFVRPREREGAAGRGGDDVNMDVNADKMQPNVFTRACKDSRRTQMEHLTTTL